MDRSRRRHRGGDRRRSAQVPHGRSSIRARRRIISRRAVGGSVCRGNQGRPVSPAGAGRDQKFERRNSSEGFARRALSLRTIEAHAVLRQHSPRNRLSEQRRLARDRGSTEEIDLRRLRRKSEGAKNSWNPAVAISWVELHHVHIKIVEQPVDRIVDFYLK